MGLYGQSQIQTNSHMSLPMAKAPVPRKQPWEWGQLRAGETSCRWGCGLPLPPAPPQP